MKSKLKSRKSSSRTARTPHVKRGRRGAPLDRRYITPVIAVRGHSSRTQPAEEIV